MDRQQEQPLIGESQAFLEVLEHVSRVAQLNRPVLVIGERGTGKELVAARIHYLSPRWDRPFVELNCATLAETLTRPRAGTGRCPLEELLLLLVGQSLL